MDRYEEALARAKQGLPIDQVFPELAESEDERIRKALIRHFNEKRNCVGDTWGGFKCDDVIAYLERQKEQPAEWSEGDREKLNGIIERGQSLIPLGELSLLPEQVAFLMELPERFCHQQKQEWNIEDARPGDILATDMCVFLFREVDETSVYSYCVYSPMDGKFSTSESAYVDAAYVYPADPEQRAMLIKAIQNHVIGGGPHWKPSEEQMEALKFALGEGGKYDKEALLDLRNQLEKMM